MRCLNLKPMCSSHHYRKKVCHNAFNARIKDSAKKRLALLVDDLKVLHEARVANIVAVDIAVRETFKHETEVRKSLIEKWTTIAKDDMAAVKECCHKSKNDDESESEAEQHIGNQEKPPAAEAYYEPWVIDD